MARRLLSDQEAAIGTHRDGACHGVRIEVGDRPARPRRRVVDHHVRHALGGDHGVEQAADFLGFRGLAGEGCGRGLAGERGQPIGIARRQRHLQAVAREQPRQGSAQTAAHADDQC